MNNPESQTPRSPAPPPHDPAPRKRRPIAIGIAALVVIGGALLWWHPWKKADAPANGQAAGHSGGRRHGGPADFANQPQPVQVATAASGEMPIVLSALGTVTPLANVTVKTQLSGYLQSVNFTEGQMVKKGDLLAQIDPRPYQVSLETAQGTLARDQALLATARLDLQRYQTLLSQDSISKQQTDTQASLVKQYEGTVKTDQASIDSAKLNLTYARITAPVSGRVGLRQVDAGNYVTSGDTNGIVVITQLQPMSVLFTTSEDNLPQILKQVNAGQTLSVTAYNRNNTVPLEAGSLETLDNQVDTTTGTVKLRATFANKNNLLFPNQFVNTRLLVDTLRNAVIVPTAAVQTGSIGQFVYIVKPDNTVTVRKVKPGPVDGERTSIADGVKVGERVVTDGVDRLREGSKITIPAAHPQGASGAAAASGASGAHAHGASGASGAHGHRHHGASQSAAQ
ncbi:MdtA/MuxA family multidrug efflux RND transporter periplasmic adaptor subunit [Burkholderia sp. Ac-20379]|uniref:MdtA/MuxA family multidrug efflux RND transporter periplasmic adaptor subunit n=1 Tax=Burkholderia sp. Ac-20379 TaxID=2703900 RepID=UPI00197E4E35|nr:MdtA/MuxA family multidrug efflux RND transporter periplasmic adaptor subunit [Burkholderia sp. Ac-20379]MBN3724753.1 MdtA/MuxA family multidrug efflux RND transporter periplasmic adaptor subunit [Burkholderia sp. Ac-20379]